MSIVDRHSENPLLVLMRKGWALWVLVLGSVLVVYGALVLAGAPPGHAVADLVKGSLGNAASISATLREVTPLLICGIAVFLALKAGLFNIGVEGQFTVGALATAIVAGRIPGPIGMLAGILAGVVAGGLWALPAAAIKAYRNGHEVITTIMLNNIAVLFATALVAGPLKDPVEQNPQTAKVRISTHLPNLFESGNLQVSTGLLIGIVLAVGFWIWLKRSVAAYELQAVGANPRAARFAGINTPRVTLMALVSSGAIGGLAGAVQVLGTKYYFEPSLSSGYGFDALGVALLGGGTPLGLLPSSALFGILNKGSTLMQVSDQVPKGITSVILGLLIIIAAAIRYRNSAVANG